MKYALAAFIALLSFEIGTSLYFWTPASPNVLALIFLVAGALSFPSVSRDARSAFRTRYVFPLIERYSVWFAILFVACAGAGWLMRDTVVAQRFAGASGLFLCIGTIASIWENGGHTGKTDSPDTATL